MECSFADVANCHGFKHARWRGLWRQAIQDLLIATVQNLRKLLRHLSQTDPELASYLLQLFYRPAKTGFRGHWLPWSLYGARER
jgi:hypothetical protein